MRNVTLAPPARLGLMAGLFTCFMTDRDYFNPLCSNHPTIEAVTHKPNAKKITNRFHDKNGHYFQFRNSGRLIIKSRLIVVL